MNSMFSDVSLGSMLGRGMQISYVVADLDSAIGFWTDKLGIGPFVVIEDAATDRQLTYKGKTTPVEFSLAFSYARDIQVELVSPGTGPSPWRDFLASGREGLHHLAFWPEDYDRACEELQRVGFSELCRIETPSGISSRYFDSPPAFGAVVELAPATPSRRQLYAAIKGLCERWNGEHPVRRFQTREDCIASLGAVGSE